ncbi:MAG: hypothetical protein H6Q64_408 [Firmicutes bacterium]|nr:hypothetical protein [Bacillota bacterium]
MNCQHYRDLMFDYFEGALDSPMQDEIKLHLCNCEFCRRQFELTEQEDQILKDTSDIPEFSDAFNSSVMAMIKAGAGNSQIIVMERKPRFRWLPAFSKASIAAILLLSCLYVPGILPHFQNSKTPQQAALIKNSLTPPASILPQDSIKEKTGTKQLADLNAGAGIETQDALKKESANDITSSSEQLLQNETQPDVFMAKNLPDSDNPSENGTQGGTAPAAGETSRSLQSSLRFAGINNNPSIYNIPDGFVLKETNNISETQVAYSYEDPSVQKSFVVNVFSANPVAEIKAAEDQSVIKAKEPKTIELDNIAALNNKSNRTIEYNGAAWQITVTGNMSQEELDRIAGEISLEPLSSQP